MQNSSTPTECKLSSHHGVFISGIDQQINGSFTVSCTEKEFRINGVVLQDEFIQISPALSKNHEKRIHQFITHWSQENSDFLQDLFVGLKPFYEKFVFEANFRDYGPLYETMQKAINHAIFDFIRDIEHPAISFDSLVQIAHEKLQSKFKVLLTDAIEEKKASKSFLVQIKKSEKTRIDFFVSILEQVLNKFLIDYFTSLPHKIIHQVMKEDTGCLFFNKNKYLGNFFLVHNGDSVLLINSLDIDDYLLSVVHSEGWPGWPMEVNKALVIASRTYLVEKVLQANKSKRPYHIVNTIKHQTYKGHHKFIQLKQAVDETRNIFIAHKGEPIVAMFDSCCGGVIPAKIDGLDGKKHPYLARTKQCTHCKKSWIYSWKKEFSKLEITEILRRDHPDLSEIKDIKVVSWDSAGLVKKVLVITKDKSFYISGKKMYSLFSAIKSFCYSIRKKGKNYIFQGRGFGHHMGLCQWGALGMVQDNWNYKNILQFYYPGTEFMKLSLVR